MNTDLSSTDCNHHCSDPDEDADHSVDAIHHEFNQKIDLQSNNDSTSQFSPDLDHTQEDNHEHEEDNHEKEENNHEEDIHEDVHEDDDDDDDFTFMLIGDDDEHINYDEKLFEDGKIRPVFPLFDRNLLLDGEYHIEEIDRLPVNPPVDKILIESPRGYPSSENKQNKTEDDVTGPYCEWSKNSTTTTTAELNKKSNSTGFSKLWRLREIVGRSNSDGRDAFVFLKGHDRSTASGTTSSKSVTGDGDGNGNGNGNGRFVKVNGGKARVLKTKKATVSAHEAYLKSKGGHTEEERRRSYLPYRPELMGLFTNVHGGLSKNVHPY